MIKFLFFILSAFTFSHGVFAVEISIENTKVETIKSQENDIEYEIFISLPKNYNFTDKKYPIIYLLDRDYSFFIAHNIFSHFSERNMSKEAILVGIGYKKSDEDLPFIKNNQSTPGYKKNRSRDYVPIKPKNYEKDTYGYEYSKEMGGASKFRKFIKTELYDYLSKNFRTNGQKTIVGHSYGGLFVVWSYLIDGEAFDNYIAISPSIWFDNFWVLSKVRPKKINHKAKLYVSFGENETERVKHGAKKLILRLQDAKIRNENFKYEMIQGENHSSVFPASITRGFLFID